MPAGLAGASFKHPVTVIRRSVPEALLCGGEVVCATVAAVASPTIAENTTVQIVFVMLPPECLALATVGPQKKIQLDVKTAIVQMPVLGSLVRCYEMALVPGGFPPPTPFTARGVSR